MPACDNDSRALTTVYEVFEELLGGFLSSRQCLGCNVTLLIFCFGGVIYGELDNGIELQLCRCGGM